MGHGREYWAEGACRGHDGWWGGPLHLIFFLLLVALLVVAIVWLFRRLTGPGPAASVSDPAPGVSDDAAVAALRLRYARGEVARDEFLRTMDDLIGSGVGDDTSPTATIEPSGGDDTSPTAA